MQIRVLDTPNHNDKHSNMFVMVKEHEIDTKFAFVAHQIQKLRPKPFIDGGHIGFGRCGDPEGRRLGRPSQIIRACPGLHVCKIWCF